MPFHLDLTLQQRATLSLAISIWNHQKVKNKISIWSHNLHTFKFDRGRAEWVQLIEEVLKEANKDLLRPPFRGELIHVVKELGEKIFHWYQYISDIYFYIYNEEGDIINYIGEIYWTPIGTIDEVKILQSYWLKNPNLNVGVSYYIACTNALEEGIDDLWQNVPCSIKGCYNKFIEQSNNNLYGNSYYDHLILAYWKYRRDGQLDYFSNFVLANYINGDNDGDFVDNRNYLLNQNMFFLSVLKGYNTAVKYFWKKLTQEARDSSTLYSVAITLLVCGTEFRRDYRHEKHIEIMIFLINQMTMNQKESFLRLESISDEVNYLNIEKINVKKKILLMLLSIWPWQDVFKPPLNNMLKYSEDNTELFYKILSEISSNMVKPSDSVENSKFQSMLRDVWSIIPGSTKRKMVQNFHDNYDSNFIDHLLEVGDLDSVKMIFNDPEFADMRWQFIEIGQNSCQLLIKSNKYKSLNQFMEKILRSEEEKIYFKSIINHIHMCKHFIDNGEYDLTDKFLNWKCGTIEERRQCKDDLKDYQIFINCVYTTLIWCADVDTAKKRTSRFLEWLFESEDDIACFKKEFLVNSEPLNGKEIFWNGRDRIITEEEAKKIRQILA